MYLPTNLFIYDYKYYYIVAIYYVDIILYIKTKKLKTLL